MERKGLDKDAVIQAIALKTPATTWKSLAGDFGCSVQNIEHYRKAIEKESR